MECWYCGKVVTDEGIISDKNYFCNEKCKKLHDFIILEDIMRIYCDTPGIHCGNCPIDKECSIFRKIEKQIRTEEDILQFNIPELNDDQLNISKSQHKIVLLQFIEFLF
ncbi:MAG: hypothetical protein ACFFDN_52790 [Candidatus Hodarchaeota archaeon]